jgi:hypothetical protein
MSFTGVFKDRALFHDVMDYKKLANNIITYIDSPSLVQTHVEKNIKMILKNYSVKAIEEKTMKLFTVK